ncbi:phosphate acyltransferase [Allgaiera indica]|uniref:Phosphate acyltransferase n=2 Tax=Allgaiera indica TaxID=765699 RepID=A0AAN4UQ21_9RHOB|nr:phosphate acyltransferase PlsX [Allgaiera indica]GHE00645.1 phosphate acyltransferase [Allgaiera indica]SDW58336.1 phosphate:acyl-[acyl carrier protein] acyltransferase [Allgaiera indica]
MTTGPEIQSGADSAPARAPVPASKTAGGPVVISVDAMGGDRGPAAVVAGLEKFAARDSGTQFLLHGDEAILKSLIAKRRHLAGRVTLRHAPGVVTMDEKPSQVVRNAKGTSMYGAIESVRDGEAEVAVSCGNTGALMALSMIRLRRLAGVNRPAIACLWPSRSPTGFNLMLDVGADIKADARDLLQYAMMGASYARNGMGIARPRVGLLNVGTEEHKGRAELKQANEMIAAATDLGGFDYVGFVEGGDLPSRKVDVIVTDGFTGNVALKTGEGTAKLIGDFLRDAFKATPLSRIAALLALTSLRRFQKRIDPRRVNGGVFLGLNGTVVKSHGAADATGVAAALELASQLARSGFQERLAARVASAPAPLQDAGAEGTGPQTGPHETGSVQDEPDTGPQGDGSESRAE